jgi:hypothetical protein
LPHDIKHTAIPASGYHYQTFVGIRLLCNWLDTPSLYDWVQFEADDQADAKGLDDIVAQRPDGLLELLQVKFTVDPYESANGLSWTWLLKRNGKGKSLLEKWTGAAFAVGIEKLGRVALITNRRPDAAFTSQLHERKVAFASLPDLLRKVVEEHTGGTHRAASFFSRFEFEHSYAGYQQLERHVGAELESRHTGSYGRLNLFRQAISWSTLKNSPAPVGRITLEVLRATISERQPRPLDQEFRVPSGYLPPDPDFAESFIEEAASGHGDLRILWGSPGQGKSTFLSYLCGRMTERGLSFVRHHYFLDLQDASDRFSLKSVSHSLITQIQASGQLERTPTGSQPEDLRKWLTACGAAQANVGKRFFVVIDGLDHVWRENGEITVSLDSLFAQLLPLPENISLILGTQRVDAAQLPSRLNTYADQESWVELPRMRVSTVRAWLEAQRAAGMFQLDDSAASPEQLANLSSAFERVSHGHPLVLTYTFLALVRSSVTLTAKRVNEHTPEPFGDARTYYRKLWVGLSWQAKDALHLMAADEFIWPVGALRDCLRPAHKALEDEVGHLLANVDAGLTAFHGSLYVFIAGQPDHLNRLQALLPNVRRWLAEDSTPYLRWAWLWMYESRLGDPAALLGGTTRAWAIDALTSAYPARQIYRILRAAEEIAFIKGDYEQAIRKRALRIRVDNGLNYQLDDASVLESHALRLTQDTYPALLLASEVSQSSVEGLHQFAMLCLSVGQATRAADVQERMRRKINNLVRSGSLRAESRDQLLDLYLEVAAGTGRYDRQKVLDLVRRHGRPEEVFEAFLRRASCGKDLATIMAFSGLPMTLPLRRVVEVEAVRTSAWAGAKLHEWGEFGRFKKHPLSMCWRLLYQGNALIKWFPVVRQHEALTMKTGSYDEPNFSDHLHLIFFAAVGNVMLMRGAPHQGGLGAYTERGWLSTVLGKLATAADACGALLARGDYPQFSLIYRLLDVKRPANHDHEAWPDFRAVTKAVTRIAADLFFLGLPRSRLDHVSLREWEKGQQSDLFATHHWRELFLTYHFRLLPDGVVRTEIEARERTALSTVGPFNEKATELVELCNWAASYGLSDLAERLMASAYRYGISYGWRKDWRLPSVLEAVVEFAKFDPTAAMRLIEKLAPIYAEIDTMTEKSGASTSDLADVLIRLRPDAYVRFYRYLLDQSEWYEAEKAFAAFIGTVNSATPAIGAVAAFLWGGERASVTAGANSQLDAMRARWGSGISAVTGDVSDQSRTCNDADVSAIPDIDAYPPDKLAEFAAAVRDARNYTLSESSFLRWFDHWQAKGRGAELLRALGTALASDKFAVETALLDRAFQLSLMLEGSKKAFRWLVEAHRHRHGWSEQYHGRADSAQRIALVAKHYPKRWCEFVALTSRQLPTRDDPTRVIPDVALVNLLLQVGEMPRALSVLEAIVDSTVEEFEVQPLKRPQWLDGGAL